MDTCENQMVLSKRSFSDLKCPIAHLRNYFDTKILGRGYAKKGASHPLMCTHTMLHCMADKKPNRN
jgi:hypothetical protein